jgi:hypothetical protein
MNVTIYFKSGHTMHAEYPSEDVDDDLADALLDPGVGMIIFQADNNEFLVPKDNIDYIKVHDVQSDV